MFWSLSSFHISVYIWPFSLPAQPPQSSPFFATSQGKTCKVEKVECWGTVEDNNSLAAWTAQHTTCLTATLYERAKVQRAKHLVQHENIIDVRLWNHHQHQQQQQHQYHRRHHHHHHLHTIFIIVISIIIQQQHCRRHGHHHRHHHHDQGSHRDTLMETSNFPYCVNLIIESPSALAPMPRQIIPLRSWGSPPWLQRQSPVRPGNDCIQVPSVTSNGATESWVLVVDGYPP